MRKEQRIYRYKPRNARNIKIKNALIILTTGVVIGTVGLTISKNGKKVTYAEFVEYPTKTIEQNDNIDFQDYSLSEISYNESDLLEEFGSASIDEQIEKSSEVSNYDEIVEEPKAQEFSAPKTITNGGDSVVATTSVNMRLNQNASSQKIGLLPKGNIVDRIMSVGGWDVIRYDNQISFVSSEYTTTNSVDYNNEYYSTEVYNDIARTTSSVHLRLGPSKNEMDLGLLDKDEELIVFGKSTSYNDSNDVWYLVRVRGQIGFVKASYTKSLKNEIQSFDSSLTDIKVMKLGYLNEDTDIRNAPNGNIIGYSEQYQLVEILQEVGNKCLVNIDGKVGYINKSAIKSVEDKFIVVDISTQRIFLYNNKDIVFVGKCTTGKKHHETELGYFTPYAKGDHHVFPDGHECTILWEPFNGGQGLHDAPWEENKDFGDPKYRASHGSAGCVRLPDDVAYYIKNNTTTDQKVLIKK